MRDRFIPEMHLSLGLPITLDDYLLKAKKECKNLKKLGDLRYIYQSKLDKACFQHDMAYGDFKDLLRRTAFDKLLCDKAFNIAKQNKIRWTWKTDVALLNGL